MAAQRRTHDNPREYRNHTAYEYLQGNVVRKEAIPEYEPSPRRRYVSRQVKENRAKEAALTRGYMVFLSFAAVATVAICILYLSLQASISSQTTEIASLQSSLSTIKEENDARYNNINESVSLKDIKDKAINDLGMTYASPSQIITYADPDDDYIKQYNSIPESGEKE